MKSAGIENLGNLTKMEHILGNVSDLPKQYFLNSGTSWNPFWPHWYNYIHRKTFICTDLAGNF